MLLLSPQAAKNRLRIMPKKAKERVLIDFIFLSFEYNDPIREKICGQQGQKHLAIFREAKSRMLRLMF